MSWDSFIDSMIAYSRDMYGNLHIDKACIIGKDGGNIITNSSLCTQKRYSHNLSYTRYLHERAKIFPE